MIFQDICFLGPPPTFYIQKGKNSEKLFTPVIVGKIVHEWFG
jgi:hypothetical protein